MITITEPNGRLCNQIIRNIAVSRIAEKNDLRVVYSSHAKIKQLGIPLYSGKKAYRTTIPLTDDTYEMIDATPLQSNLNPNAHYFQTQSISRQIKHYLEHASDSICNQNPYRNRYHTNNDVAIHIRLTDVAHYNPGILYYKKALTECNSYDRIYIATDEPSHPIVQELLLYPNAVCIDKGDITTIQFASTCNHVILSHGSFSALIGYLSFFSEVIYPAYDHMWYGDLFSIEGWKQIKI